MSKKKALLFKPKVVSLTLPNCPTVYFDPERCEWTTADDKAKGKGEALDDLGMLSKQIDSSYKAQ